MVFIVSIQVEINAISFSISTYLSPKPRKGCIYLESLYNFWIIVNQNLQQLYCINC